MKSRANIFRSVQTLHYPRLSDWLPTDISLSFPPENSLLLSRISISRIRRLIWYLLSFHKHRWQKKDAEKGKPAYVSRWKPTLKDPFVCGLVLRPWEWKVWKRVCMLCWQLWSQIWWESELWGAWWRLKVFWGCSQPMLCPGRLLNCSCRKVPSVTSLTGHVAKRCSLMGHCHPPHQVRGSSLSHSWKLKSDLEGHLGVRKNHPT